VIHCATHNATRNSTKDLNLVLKNNLLMYFNLANISNLFGKMLYFGSGAEYDQFKCPSLVKEEYLGNNIPTTDYGLSKYLMAVNAEKSDNIYDLALFGCFGKYEDYAIRFISNAICKTLFGLPIVIKKNRKMDYLYIDALMPIVDYFINNDCKYKRYNIVSGISFELYELAEKILKLSGNNLPIIVAEPGMQPEYTADNSRLLSEVPNLKFTDMDAAIKKLYEWYGQNKNLINKDYLLADK
jgi:GDP-L-fucose synthase